MSELLSDFFLLDVNNRIEVIILITFMIFIIFLVIVLSIIKKRKDK